MCDQECAASTNREERSLELPIKALGGSLPMIKRAFDLGLSLAGLLVLLPLFVILAVLIILGSPGPVFYRGIRVGRLGIPFRILKFRTMVANAEELGGSCTADNDIRITKIGQWLRKYKLDELPQLMNVLGGNMSLVGPRPEVQEFVDLFTEEEKQILTVRPGITDWATLWDSDEGAVLAVSVDPEQTYVDEIRPQKLRMQLQYVRQQSFWIDTRILLSTFRLVVGRLLRAQLFKLNHETSAQKRV